MSNKYPGGLITSGANAGYSVFFDGTGDYLNGATNTATAFNFTGDFTVECWAYFTSTATAGQGLVSWADSGGFNGWQFVNDAGTVKFEFLGASSAPASVTGGTVANNQWYHIACVRSGSATNNVTIYINGVATGSTTYTGTQGTSASSYVRVGVDRTLSNEVVGYLSNVRVVKGTALYTAAFTPPTQLFAITNTSLLTCNSPAIVDQSSNNFTITANGNAAVSTFTPFTGTQLVPNPNTLANTQGVWSISDAAYWMSQNKWPMPPSYPLQSLRFNSADSASLTRTPASAGSRTTWTWSGWLKKTTTGSDTFILSASGGVGNDIVLNFYINSSDKFVLDSYTNTYRVSTQVFRDVGAWYHLVVVWDTTNATAQSRARVWVNNTEITAWDTNTTISSGQLGGINGAYPHAIGRREGINDRYFNGYMSNITFVDGQALTPSSFGANDPNTGVWSPVPYSGTYGTNGFRLSFQDNTGTTATTLGRDYSGNGNNWTPNNFSVAAGSGNDSLTDGPTNWGIDYGNGGEVRGNYCTLNPLSIGTGVTLSNGGLDFSSATSNSAARSTFGVASGKWYWEVTVTTASPYFTIGVTDTSTVDNNTYVGATATSYSYFTNNGNKYNNGSASAYGATIAQNDVVGVALDMDAGTLTFYKNGVSQGTAFTGITGTKQPAISINTAATNTASCNFGQRPFAYPAPSGFKVLCTTNLPIPTVGATSTTLANKYFDADIYTGTGATQSRTLAFQPDFLWFKIRSGAANHVLIDSVRGTNPFLNSNTTGAEATATDQVTSFNSNGYTLGANTTGGSVNVNASTYVNWAWKAGGTAVTNTSGSISSQVSASTTAGISVVTWTNPASGSWTVGHGLGVAPKMIITKGRSGTNGWVTYHEALGNTKAVLLNTTAAADTNSAYWNNTSPTSSVFSMGSAGVIGASYTMVAYCFAEIAGFSKFGSYTGNGSADGPFVYCGFRPRYVMIKRTDSSTNGDWNIRDTARDPYNVTNKVIFANVADSEYSGITPYDILSNGFKLRDTGANVNGSGATYIFMAFAEAPFNYSRAR